MRVGIVDCTDAAMGEVCRELGPSVSTPEVLWLFGFRYEDLTTICRRRASPAQAFRTTCWFLNQWIYGLVPKVWVQTSGKQKRQKKMQ